MAGEASSLDTVAEADKTPAKRAQRWLLEVKLAKKREKDWRLKAEEVLLKYRGKNRKKNSFNILWSNTEVLRPALYNSTPKPDVRRRFRQSDLLGKAVSELMERSLTYCADAYDMDACVKANVLDGLLPGRGWSRVRYVPQFKAPPGAQELPASQSEAGSVPSTALTAQQPSAPEGPQDADGAVDEVDYEQALCEQGQWDDLLHGPGKVWAEVQWCAFRHRLRRDDLIEQFGAKIGGEITLNDVADDDVTDKKNGQELSDVFKRAEVWEIWDKESKQVFFVNESYRKGVFYAQSEEGSAAKEGEPPLKLRDFFPIPRPLVLLEDVGTLVPTPLFEQYREQADELNEISRRINRIVKMVKVRGVYDSTIGELAELMKAPDGDFLAAERAAAYMNNGGLEKAFWFMPVEQIAACLKHLYEAREAAKQVIYEITGIADIIRGASDPQETLGAQKIKSNNFRVQRMQREVQRYVRDLIRLLAEVIGQHFSQETLASMTGMQFPTAAQKQMIGLQMQAMQQQAQQPPPGAPGQPPQPQQPGPPPAQLQSMQNAMQMPSWDDIMGCLRADICREYRVDVETDSTVAEQLQNDMTGLKEVLTGIVGFWQGVAPGVTSGAISMEAVKSITMSIVRRARMGLEVEDALEAGMQQPKPAADPNAGKAAEAQAKMQLQAQELQQRAAAEKAEGERQVAVEVAKHQREMAEQQAEFQARSQELAQKHASEMQEHARDFDIEKYKADLDASTRITVAEISAKAGLDQAAVAAEQAANEKVSEDLGDGGAGTAAANTKRRSSPIDRLEKMHADQGQMHAKTLEAIQGLAQVHALPKRIVRSADGRAVGVETVKQ